MKIVIYTLLLLVSLSSAKEILGPETPAPRFLIKNTTGQRIGLRNYTNPKSGEPKPMTLISFWSLSCVPCRKEMPVLEAFAKNNNSDVNIAFINLDTKNRQAEVQLFLKKYNIQSTVLLDIYQSTGKKFDVCEGQNCNVPALFGLDKNGIIKFSIAGYDEKEDLAAKLSTYLLSIKGGASPTIVKDSAVTPQQGSTVISDSLRLSITHDALVKSPFKELEEKYKLSKKELISILKESEDILKRQWNIISPSSPQ